MPSAEKPTVLLVDDNYETCTLITAVLQRDFQVETAGDGRETIEKLRIKQYAAILLDLLMPLADGFSVLDFLKSNNPEALRTVLVVTAVLTRREIERAKSYGICGIISKPFDVDALREAVRQCVDPAGPRKLGDVFCSTPMIFLIADLLRQRLL
jgi:CheY-like chemotaxis protein